MSNFVKIDDLLERKRHFSISRYSSFLIEIWTFLVGKLVENWSKIGDWRSKIGEKT